MPLQSTMGKIRFTVQYVWTECITPVIQRIVSMRHCNILPLQLSLLYGGENKH